MTMSVIWLDLENAKLFHFSEDRMERSSLKATHIDHHTHRRENDERDCVSMYDELAARLVKTQRILILGPGVAKDHFFNRMKDRFPDVAKRVVGCESSDHPTDNQIAAYAIQYFNKPVTS